MIAKMEVPNLSDHRFLQKWMDSPSMGNISLLGADYSIWEDLDTSDLVTLNSRKSADLVTRVIADGALPLYHRLIGQWLKVGHLQISVFPNHTHFLIASGHTGISAEHPSLFGSSDHAY